MNTYSLFVTAALVAVSGIWQAAAEAQSLSPPRDLGREVLGVFSAKCAGCHGPDLPKPKGRFGYILDLKRLAGDTEKVIPPNPDESELWALVSHDEMPPPDAPRGPLSKEQKEIIRAWIAGGAPPPAPPVPSSRTMLPLQPQGMLKPESEVTATVEPSPIDAFVRWIGKFHLLLLHFPIALVVAAGTAEVISTWRRDAIPSESTRYCLWLAALAAVPTAALGWLFAAAGNGAGSPELLNYHRWLGTAAAAWLAVTAICAERDARFGKRSHFVRLLLVLGIMIMAITAHLGGLLTHGVDFFNY